MATNESLKKILLKNIEEGGENTGEVNLTPQTKEMALTLFKAESSVKSKTFSTVKSPSKIGEEKDLLSYLKVLLSSEEVRKDFSEVLKERTLQYLDSILNLVSSDVELKSCHPKSILESCRVAATLNLPIDKNLGYGYITPHKDITSFSLGYKGYIQLALRTGMYKGINVIKIHEGQLIAWNPLTEELVIDFHKKQSEAVIGYGGTFQLLNGYKKTVYWTKEAMENHREICSKKDLLWQRDFDAMAMKTVVSNMLSKWGILSFEMQEVYSKEINQEKEIHYGGI